MSERTEQLKGSIDNALRTLQARAEALSAHLRLTKRKRAERINRRMQSLRDTLDELKAEAQRRRGLASETKQMLVTAVDDLKVQIILGKAEGTDFLEVEHKRLRTSLRRFEQSIDHLLAQTRPKIGAAVEALMREYADSREALNTELEAAAARLKEEACHGGAAFEKRKKILVEQVGHLEQRLGEQRKRFSQKLKQFEAEAKPGLDQIGKALKQLFA
jgi:hypothetical protein